VGQFGILVLLYGPSWNFAMDTIYPVVGQFENLLHVRQRVEQALRPAKSRRLAMGFSP
jgi:hypothetical protein